MRIAVVASSIAATEGGASTFEESVSEALKRLRRPNIEFVFFPISLATARAATRRGLRQIWLKAWSSLLRLLGFVPRSDLQKLQSTIESEGLPGALSWNTDNPLNHAINQAQCELVYFLTPRLVPVDAPFVATHWDLGHRQWPIFPEVNRTGWTWGQREWYYTHQLPRAALIVTGTETGKSELQTAYGLQARTIAVNPFPVPTWVSQTQESSVPGLERVETFFYYPAQFWPHKNHVLLIEGLKILKDQGKVFHLVFTGSDKGNLAYIQQLVVERGLGGQVHFPGFVSREQLKWLYRNCRAMVFPCILGPDNLPPLEALACGTPVAVADIPGCRDYLPFEGVAFFDPFDEQKLAALMVSIAERRPAVTADTQKALPSTQDYAQKIADFLEKLGLLRRCWGPEYTHT